MELIGTVAFAISGALVAINKKLDYYGILFLAMITAVGGGIIRDVIINLDPLPVAIQNPIYVIVSCVSALLVIAFYKWFNKLHVVVTVCDAIGLAAFTAIGAKAAVVSSTGSLFVVITLAMLTGVGGGILRDVFAKEIPFVFRKEVYAIASLLGAIVFYVANWQFGVTISMYICFAVTLVIRLVSVKYNWNLARVNTGTKGNE
jgi:uncharacterized membrane protein YeiH